MLQEKEINYTYILQRYLLYTCKYKKETFIQIKKKKTTFIKGPT